MTGYVRETKEEENPYASLKMITSIVLFTCKKLVLKLTLVDFNFFSYCNRSLSISEIRYLSSLISKIKP